MYRPPSDMRRSPEDRRAAREELLSQAQEEERRRRDRNYVPDKVGYRAERVEGYFRSTGRVSPVRDDSPPIQLQKGYFGRRRIVEPSSSSLEELRRSREQEYSRDLEQQIKEHEARREQALRHDTSYSPHAGYNQQRRPSESGAQYNPEFPKRTSPFRAEEQRYAYVDHRLPKEIQHAEAMRDAKARLAQELDQQIKERDARREKERLAEKELEDRLEEKAKAELAEERRRVQEEDERRRHQAEDLISANAKISSEASAAGTPFKRRVSVGGHVGTVAPIDDRLYSPVTQTGPRPSPYRPAQPSPDPVPILPDPTVGSIGDGNVLDALRHIKEELERYRLLEEARSVNHALPPATPQPDGSASPFPPSPPHRRSTTGAEEVLTVLQKNKVRLAALHNMANHDDILKAFLLQDSTSAMRAVSKLSGGGELITSSPAKKLPGASPQQQQRVRMSHNVNQYIPGETPWMLSSNP